MGFETQDVDRKILSILRALDNSPEPAGSRKIAELIRDQGVTLGERAVRYHLKLLDERGLTTLVGKYDGRAITEKGRYEIRNAMVRDKVGYAISRIELLSFRTNFESRSRTGNVPVNVSIFDQASFKKALQMMKPIFESNFCVSKLVAIAEGGQKIGDVTVPGGKIGLATVCSIIINGALLKAGVPMDSRFGGILEIHEHKPLRFTEVIHYDGCSLDPSEIFIRARMTSVGEAVLSGSGKILANFREIPSACMSLVDEVLAELKAAGLGGAILLGNVSEPVCETPVEPNRVGVILVGGLNPVAAAQELGFNAENHSMSTVIDYRNLIKYTEI
jgi:repressor of nif and glnA expression